MVQETTTAYGIGVDAGVRDGLHHKGLFDDRLDRRDYSDVRAYVIVSSAIPDIMCSFSYFPTQSFSGAQLQDLGELATPPKMISFTSWCTGDAGAFVFAWLAESDAVCIPFVKSLEALPDTAIANALVRFMFEYCENVHLRPDWWETLPPKASKALIERMAQAGNPFVGFATHGLKDDGVSYVTWPIVSRKRVGY